MRELPGRDMIMNICLASEIWHNWRGIECPQVLFYAAHGEFSLGRCDDDNIVRRIDSIISVRPPHKIKDPMGGCLLGFEVKANIKDLENDTKLTEHYLKSGVCDYHYLIAADDNIAAKALEKYRGFPSIGVASYSSGRIFKCANRCCRTQKGIDWYPEMMRRREAAPNDHQFHSYFIQDKDIVMLLPKEKLQLSPVLRISSETEG